MMSVAFETLGCKVNQYETEAMAELFISRGYKIVEYEQIADIYIINTCTVTNLGDKKSRQAIRKAKRQNPNSILAVCGCYSQIEPEKVCQIDGVNIVVGTKYRDKIVDLIESYDKNNGVLNLVSCIDRDCEFEKLSVNNMANRTRAYIKIQDGCNQFCTYCIIPYARGNIRSRMPDDIMSEVKNIVTNGFKEVVLTGIHIASYGKDLDDMNLLKITQMIHSIDGLERIRFSSIEPNILTDRFLDGITNLPKVCDHMHLSLQSGCDRILKLMNRHYSTQQYLESVKRLKQYMPNSAVTTDIIVGFPSETDRDFEDTCEFIQQVKFSKIHVFPYSPKTGTPAAKMKEQIENRIKNERVKKIYEIEKYMRYEFLKQNLNKKLDVLFEKQLEKGIFEGYTTNYIKVFSNSDIDLKNNIKAVKLVDIKNDSVRGEILFA